MVKTITLSQPIKKGLATGQDCQILIHEIPQGGYRVNRARFKSGSSVTWRGSNFTPDDIIVYLPRVGEIHQSEFPVTIYGEPGVYQYGLFVVVDGGSHAVEGNSPPEMIIE
jgi:hypothetical protein